MLRELYPTITFSSLYKTAARDVETQDDFLNAAAKIETEDSIDELYENLLQIEKELKKDPPYEKGPRTIDLDILTCEPITNHESRITIPHPRMTERRFVLEPLCELSNNPKWQEYLEDTVDQECKKTEIIL